MAKVKVKKKKKKKKKKKQHTHTQDNVLFNQSEYWCTNFYILASEAPYIILHVSICKPRVIRIGATKYVDAEPVRNTQWDQIFLFSDFFKTKMK